ncbi:hypothetical protein [Rhizobium herbae]|uniref:PspA/IM30 family protein n=1 Tax=Rhizobium herbae TaxID=508661 RepID=A0ABS4EPN0_9HYPH|nr:hypothetical protein [Rhizobium herbae]MBP1859776.1 hypothetical protein [Rhizobium herbae]
MTNSKTNAETILDTVRRALAKAVTADAILAAGEPIPDLIIEIETARDALDDDIAAEAESIDRSRSNKLRAERSALGDLLSDAEYLERRIDEKHKGVLKAETDAAMRAKQTSALKKQAQAQAALAALAEPLRAVVSGVTDYQCLAAEIDGLNNELRGSDRHELCVRPPLHAVAKPNEALGEIFDFVRVGKFNSRHGEPNLIDIADRLKTLKAGK